MPTRRARPRPTPLPGLSAAQRELVAHYHANRCPLKPLAARLGVTYEMLRRELLGVRLMPPERAAALRELL